MATMPLAALPHIAEHLSSLPLGAQPDFGFLSRVRRPAINRRVQTSDMRLLAAHARVGGHQGRTYAEILRGSALVQHSREPRRGEIIAIRWQQVDLANAQLAVVESAEQTGKGVRYKRPKSGRSRTVALSRFVVDELRVHRLRQAEELLRLGARQNEATFVYTREDGEPMQPRSLTHAWHRMLARTSLRRIRFHDLRHTHATHLLSSGVHPKVASERLGHSKVGITLDLYSHVLPGMQADAASPR